MKILVAGASGLIGSELLHFLRSHGHQVKQLTHSKNLSSDVITWDPEKGVVPIEALEGFDAIINLSGENIASGRWTAAKKKAILDSRVNSTRALCASFAQLQSPPKLLINASAIGYYGDQGEKLVTEEDPSGKGFLAEVCQEWERAALAAQELGIRVIRLRLGIVLSTEGGVLAKLLLPFKMGLGGVIGNGKQYMSWITMNDLLKLFGYVLTTESLSGPINAVTPYPVTNKEFTKSLGRVLQRPTFLAIPAFAARLALGEMANELLLSGTRATPQKLLHDGFAFTYPELEEALHHLLMSKNS